MNPGIAGTTPVRSCRHEHRRRSVMLRHGVMVVLALAVMAPRSGSAADRMTLTDANRRWHGAWCRSREPIFLSGNVDRNGVIRSRWIAWKRPGVTNPNAPPAAMARFFFSGGDSLMRSYPNGSIPQQARFKAFGWSEEKRGGPIYLEVQLPDLQIKGRLYFYTPKQLYGWLTDAPHHDH